jgi:glycosyltransferase involved in cell wall biosynthesis
MSPRIMFVTHTPPLPAVSGERIRAINLIRALASRGWGVSVFSLDPDGLVGEQERRELATLCEFVMIEPYRVSGRRRSARVLRDTLVGRPFHLRYFYDERGASHLRRHLDQVEYDVVQVCQLYMIDYVPEHRAPRIVFDSVNVEARRLNVIARSNPRSPRGIVSRLQSRSVQRLERNVANRSVAVLAVSDDEADYFRAISSTPVQVVPNGVDVHSWPKPVTLTHEHNILLMGSLTYSANVDSVLYFLDAVAPRLATHDVTVTVMGYEPPPAVLAAARKSVTPVHVTGYVESSRPYLENSRVLAVPLRHGAGTRLKILEALAAGVPVVSTRIGCEGLGLVHEREIIVADKPDEFAVWIDRLLADDALCASLANSGRIAVRDRFDWRVIGSKLDVILRGLLSKKEAVEETVPKAGFPATCSPPDD